MEMRLRYSKSHIAAIIREDAAGQRCCIIANIDNELCDKGTCSDCDETRESLIKIYEFFVGPPITLFQVQLIKWGACPEGRMRVGAKTAREWWSSSSKVSDMLWVLNTLGAPRLSVGFHDSLYSMDDPDLVACDRIRAAYPFEKLQELSKGK